MTIGDPNDFNSTYYDWPVPQQQQTVRQRELSTWGEAIVAAATNDVAMMYQLLDGEHDDGLGVDLRTFRTSKADVNFVKTHRNIVIDPFYTLAEIAIERDQDTPLGDLHWTPALNWRAGEKWFIWEMKKAFWRDAD